MVIPIIKARQSQDPPVFKMGNCYSGKMTCLHWNSPQPWYIVCECCWLGYQKKHCAGNVGCRTNRITNYCWLLLFINVIFCNLDSTVTADSLAVGAIGPSIARKTSQQGFQKAALILQTSNVIHCVLLSPLALSMQRGSVVLNTAMGAGTPDPTAEETGLVQDNEVTMMAVDVRDPDISTSWWCLLFILHVMTMEYQQLLVFHKEQTYPHSELW